ncbi:kinase-like protein [Mytilinidion resinicola]|uniref:Kinase-like protein n=1 Tax=Mytilinidion resinicola TaxID=574789 RepID=A0A6A6YV88_9PEZI|nr:kinase-like protein [Mytilinidion resinicola]KAF2812458.1 kinase-like protein [Mytilinidion resinicola]
MSKLRDELSKLRKDARCARERKHFYPLSEITELLTFDQICASLRSNWKNERDVARFASLIHETNLKTFAILLLNRDDAHIVEFLFRRETDSKIPYSDDGLYFLPPLVAREFLERQWEFHPVIFEKGDIHRKVREEEILPILEEEKAGEGGFGTVWRVKLHPRCQRLVPSGPETASERPKEAVKGIVVAWKELKDGDTGDDERAILELLQTLRHPNIVEFLGSYAHHGVHNLLFPYVPMDLKRLLAGMAEMPLMDPHKIYSGIYGLADALNKIHDFTFKDENAEISKIGYHHDLRPANILVKNDVFMIADFGLSKLKPDDKDSKTRLRGGHDDYLGPESFKEADWTNGIVGRALDVWAFGCILTEMASLIERRNVEDFRIKREATHGTEFLVTDSAFHLAGVIRPAVTKWLSDLTEDPKDQQVQELVKLALDMLNPNPYKRIKISAAASTLALLTWSSNVGAVDRLFDGLSYNNVDRRSDFHVLVLLEYKRFGAWKSAFGRLHHDERLRSTDTVLASLSHLLDVLRSGEIVARGANSSQSEADEFLRKVSTAVDSACATLPIEAQEGMQELWSREVSEIQEIEVLAAIRAAPKPERYRSVGIKVAMRYMSCAISSSIRVGGRSRYIESGCVEIDETSLTTSLSTGGVQLIEDKSRTMGFYTGEHGRSRVMVEWKEYDTRWRDGSGQILHETMDSLVNLLDPLQTPRQGVTKDRVLDCVGYFHEPRNYRFGFIYILNPLGGCDAASSAQLCSVNNIMRMTDPYVTDTIRPDLGDIFHLAKDLSSCLLALHDAGWLHKNISSHYVLAFSPSLDTVHQHIASAVLTGFNDSRPEASGFTLGPKQEFLHYQHPLYRRGLPFRKSFDYFGLGIVLMELGLWLPVSIIRYNRREIISAEDFRKKLLKSYVTQLGEKMGTLYRDAVRFCLDAEDDIQSMQEDAEGCRIAQEMFKVKVVQSISRCFA